MNSFLISLGYFGMFIASFLAGTFVPFSSEAVMGALTATTRFDDTLLIIAGTLGNVAGMLVNYGLGRLCPEEYIIRKFHVKPKRLDKAQKWVERYGIRIAFLCFLPFMGTVIGIVLGMFKANVWKSASAAAVGMLLRYIIVVLSISSIV